MYTKSPTRKSTVRVRNIISAKTVVSYEKLPKVKIPETVENINNTISQASIIYLYKLGILIDLTIKHAYGKK